jgi:hypothetical protein
VVSPVFVLPLVSVRMPVQFAHAARFNLDQGGRDCLRDRKILGIRDPNSDAFGIDRRLRQHVVTEGLRDLGRAGNLVARERSRHQRGENVSVARIQSLGQRGSPHAEILGHHLRAIVEHEQRFGAARIEALDRVRNAGRKIPKITHTDVVDEIAPIGVDRGDARPRPIWRPCANAARARCRY